MSTEDQLDVKDRVSTWHVGDPDAGDTHAFWSELRDQCPVARSDRHGGHIVVTRYDDIIDVLQDPGTFSSTANTIPDTSQVRPKFIPFNYDPPEHTAYRQLFAAYFAPRNVAKAEAEARKLFIELIEGYIAKGGGDFIQEVAMPFPCITFMLILGAPLEDTNELVEWNHVINHGFDSPDPAVVDYALNVVQPKIVGYVDALVASRENVESPPDDLLTALSRAEVDGVPLTLEEKRNTVLLFLGAGLDTVTAQLALMVERLAGDPRLREQLIADPGLIPNAVEEFMRIDSIISLARKATTDTEISGCPVGAGDMVQLLTPSAGRDADHYDNPDEVDFTRDGIKHLGFGGGPHRCQGSHLARMELRIALEEMMVRMPHFSVSPGVHLERHWGAIAGLENLPLTVDAS